MSAMKVFSVQMACSKVQSETESCLFLSFPLSEIQVCGVPSAYDFAPPLPAGHPVHVTVPVLPAYVPEGHTGQWSCQSGPVAAHFPVTQSVHEASELAPCLSGVMGPFKNGWGTTGTKIATTWPKSYQLAQDY
jgi:hypothetical protein